jgi:periplasmic divalent cation tolerance protein
MQSPPVVSSGSCLVVLSSAPARADAERIAAALVESRLAACVSIVPGLLSIYRWQGAVERGDEVLLVIKTTREAFEPLRRTLVALHPYEVPEVLALPVDGGHAPYLAWLDASVDPLGDRAVQD